MTRYIKNLNEKKNRLFWQIQNPPTLKNIELHTTISLYVLSNGKKNQFDWLSVSIVMVKQMGVPILLIRIAYQNVNVQTFKNMV